MVQTFYKWQGTREYFVNKIDVNMLQNDDEK